MVEKGLPFKLGLTGSIGMGKTETAKLFARLGIPIYDADAVVHALYDTGGAAVTPIERTFPGAVRDGKVDRAKLAALLAGDKSKLSALEAIVHPLAADARRKFLISAAARGEKVVLLDIPLLFETGAQKEMDAVVVVSAPASVQRERVLAREGMTEEKLALLLSRQVPDAQKRAQADFIVETGKGLEHAFEQVQSIVRNLREKIGN